MENASKALIIAGGVLIALIIITMFIMMFNNLANTKKAQEEQTKTEQISAFNAEFEAYNKKIMYGTDVITLINKVAENNKKNLNNIENQITLILDGKIVTNSSELIGTDAEKSIYTSVKTEYNNSGRICKIEIKKR